jgi:hypothetical protein
MVFLNNNRFHSYELLQAWIRICFWKKLLYAVYKMATGWTKENFIRFPAEARDHHFLQEVQTGSGVHSASYWIDARNVYPEVKRL